MCIAFSIRLRYALHECTVCLYSLSSVRLKLRYKTYSPGFLSSFPPVHVSFVKPRERSLVLRNWKRLKRLRVWRIGMDTEAARCHSGRTNGSPTSSLGFVWSVINGDTHLDRSVSSANWANLRAEFEPGNYSSCSHYFPRRNVELCLDSFRREKWKTHGKQTHRDYTQRDVHLHYLHERS